MDDDLGSVARIYIAALALLALVVGIGVFALSGTPHGGDLVLGVALCALLGAASSRPLPFGPHAHLTLDTAVILATVFLLPSGLVIPVAGLGVLLANLPRRADWSQAIFNASQTALQAAVAAGMLGITGWDPRQRFDDPRALLLVPLAGAAMHLTNVAAVASIVSIQTHEQWRLVALRTAVLDRREATGHVAQWGLAVLAAVVVTAHAWSLALLVLPGSLVFGALDHHARLRLRAEERIVRLAYHDPLTGLPNRSRFLERLETALAAVADRVGTLAVLFLDLDRFKLVNDTLGHEAGDRLLIEVADRMRAAVRDGDMVARLGGDEFTVILEDVVDAEEARHVADRITAALSAPFDLGPRTVVTAASIGIVLRGTAHHTPADLLRDADVALYRAKDAGRARALLYDDAMGAAAQARVQLEDELRRAVDRDEFILLYQPQINLRTGRLVGVEALMRWVHPDRGVIEPSTFLAVAEETGLIVPIGRWVLRAVCLQARSWADRFHVGPVYGVNLSAPELAESGLAAAVDRTLAETGWHADRLRIDVKEAAAVAGGETSSALAALRNLGVSVAIDDFGVGAWQPAQLGRLLVDTVKLDSSLVAGCDDAPEAAALVRAVVGLARGFGLSVVAEGVETPGQVKVLRESGCDVAQGRWFAPPLTVPAFERWLDDRTSAGCVPVAGANSTEAAA